jgi:hypothetical protein
MENMKNKEQFLFIGGVADGQYIDVYNYYSIWQIMSFPGMDFSQHENFDIYSCQPIESTTYKKITWSRDNKTKIQFFALDTLSEGEIMDMVFDNYKPKQDVLLNNTVNTLRFHLENCLSILRDIMNYVTPNPFTRKTWDVMLKAQKYLYKLDK